MRTTPSFRLLVPFIFLALGGFLTLQSPATPAAQGNPTPIPITPEDLYLPGTQPGALTANIIVSGDCSLCHSNYGQQEVEPIFNWRGSMMAQSARDPLFWAALTVANQDVEGIGSACLRCHTPKGWLEGRSTPADGSALTSADYDGINCHFCHRMLDPVYTPGVSPSRDETVLAALPDVPGSYASGMYVVDPEDERRGPWNLRDEGWYVPDCTPAATCGEGNPHRPLDWPWESEFHHQSALCATCHDLLSPVFTGSQAEGYTLDPTGQPIADPATGFPTQRTYTEWLLSSYATEEGVYAPQFNPNLPGGIIHGCHDCHMPEMPAASAGLLRFASQCRYPDDTPCPTQVTHDLAAVHDFTGANTWVPEMIKIHPVFGSQVNATALDAGVVRARAILQKAATLTGRLEGNTLFVRVSNETGHKLPTGYPEGRQLWLSVTAYDVNGEVVYTSGVYSETAATLLVDPDLQWFGVSHGLSDDWAAQIGMAAGSSFHLVLNNEITFDNRIPPRGFDNAAFLAAGAAPVGVSYADGQYWAEVEYALPEGVARVEVALDYQLASREYIEFLRESNFTDGNGQLLSDLWEQTGKSPPEVLANIEVGRNIWLPVVVVSPE